MYVIRYFFNVGDRTYWLVGPFDTASLAREYANQHLRNYCWDIAPLAKPE